MFPFADLSDEDIARQLPSQGGTIQSAMIAELHRRQSAKVHAEISTVRETVSSVRAELSGVQQQLKTLDQLKTLPKTHRIHLWILWIAALTLACAVIAALDPILRWFRRG
jgi:hypothetical protein